jgi:hypothetical protein
MTGSPFSQVQVLAIIVNRTLRRISDDDLAGAVG